MLAGRGNDVLQGGAGGDFFNGASGVNTLSYSNSSSGVSVSIFDGSASGGDAEGDEFYNFTNLIGSAQADTLSGDDNANTLIGNGGADTIYGLGGNDRIFVSGSPSAIDGGLGKDILIVTGEATFDGETFAGIEATYVRNSSSVDFSTVTSGQKIVSQSTSGYSVEILGSAGKDVIYGGKGSDFLAGGAGNDKLFAGAGADTFTFGEGFGRDAIYKFDVNADRFDVSQLADSFDDLVIKSVHGGDSAQITFVGADQSQKIVVYGVAAADLNASDFLFGIS